MNVDARPDSRFDEDELLSMQKKFLARSDDSGAIASTRVVRTSASKKQETTDSIAADEPMDHLPSPPTSSEDSRQRRRRHPPSPTIEDDEDVEASLEAADKKNHVTSVLARILERPVNPKSSRSNDDISILFPTKSKGDLTGFPVAPHRRDVVIGDGARTASGAAAAKSAAAAAVGAVGQKPKSLFAQQMAAAKNKKFGANEKEGDNSMVSGKAKMRSNNKPELPSGPAVIDGSGLVRWTRDDDDDDDENDKDDKSERKRQHVLVTDIHRENESRLASMDEETIMAEQQKLVKSLDPSLLAFLKSKKHQVQQVQQVQQQQKPVQHQTRKSSMYEAKSEISDMKDSVMKEVIDLDKQSPCPNPQPIKVKDIVVMDAVNMDNSKETTGSSTFDHLPIKPSKDFINMDVVETEKLEWLKDVSKNPGVAKAKAKRKSKADGDSSNAGDAQEEEEEEESVETRFDFEGRVLDGNADFPTDSALYHHDDQTKAGYTLQELFSLARSQFVQQRVLALRTLAKIVFHARLGISDAVLSQPLFPHLLEAGIVFLFRWALDDTNLSVATAAIQGFHALLVIEAEEVLLDRVYSWSEGMLCPSLEPLADDDDGDEEEEEDGEAKKMKSDVEVMGKDVVLALMQMNFLQRLRYILEVVRPDPESVLNIFDILTRLCRHSTHVAAVVMKTPRLLSTLVQEFLVPLDKPGNEVYGQAQPKVVKLLRILISMSGRQAAVSLNSPPFSLISKLTVFVALRPDQQSSRPLEVASALTRESSRLLSSMVFFNVAVDDLFDTLFPVLAENLRTFSRLSLKTLSTTSSSSLFSTMKSDFSTASDAMNLISAFVSNCRNFESKPSNFRNDLLDRDAERQRVDDAALPYCKVKGFLEPLTDCCGRWMRELAAADADVKKMLAMSGGDDDFNGEKDAIVAFADLVANTLKAVIDLFRKWSEISASSSSSSSSSSDAIFGKARLVAEAELFAKNILLPFVVSPAFELLASKLTSTTSLSGFAGADRASVGGVVPQLPTLRALSIGSSSSSSASSSSPTSSSLLPPPSLTTSSPMAFLLSFSDAVSVVSSIAPKSKPVCSLLSKFLFDTGLTQFVSDVGKAKRGDGGGREGKSSCVSPWFLLFEISFVQRIIEAFLVLQRSMQQQPQLLQQQQDSGFSQTEFSAAEENLHKAALRIFPRLSDASTVFKFIQSIVFAKSFVKSSSFFSHPSSTRVVTGPGVDVDETDMEISSNYANEVSTASDFRLHSAAGDDISVSRLRLLQLTEENLTQIRGCYMDCLSSIVASSGPGPGGSGGVPSLVRDRSANLLTEDWMYLPLIQSYQRCIKLESKGKSPSPAESVKLQRHLWSSLLFLHFLEILRPEALSGVGPTARLARIYCVFLCGSDFFFQRDNYALMASLLRVYVTENLLSRLDFSSRVPGISSFYDLYQSVLEQYEAESFNDLLFASYLLFPIQQRHGTTFRRLFWIEHGDCLLSTFSLPVADVALPIQSFLHPPETDAALLRHYLQALMSGHLSRSPLLHLIAVSHVSRFIFAPSKEEEKSNLRKLFLHSIKAAWNGRGGGDGIGAVGSGNMTNKIVGDILHFRSFDTSSPNGLGLFSEIPPERAALL